MVRLREVFLSRATKFFQATTDAERERLRERVVDAGYGLEAGELQALADAARLRAQGRGTSTSPLTAEPTHPNLENHR